MNKRVDVLGVGISVTNMSHTLDSIVQWVKRGEKKYVCITGVHGVMESQLAPELMRIHNQSGLTVPDGRPMFWLGRLAGNAQMGPVPGEQLSLALCKRAAREGLTLFFYGGDVGVAQELAEKLRERYPGLRVVGTYTPPFRPLDKFEEAELIAQVKKVQPDLFWVGLSTPKQERFMAEYLPKLDTKVMLGVGAVFDYHTGRIARTPELLRSMGLAWLYRLYCEPKRLWKRYAYNNPLFVARVISQKLGLKHYRMR